MIFFEGRYEAEEPHASTYANEPLYRNQIWGAFCAGAAGIAYGSNPEYHFEHDLTAGVAPWWGSWKDALNYPLRLEMAVFSDWIDSVGDQWAELEPDLIGSFLVVRRASRLRTLGGALVGVEAEAVSLPSPTEPDGGDALEFDMSQLAPSRIVISKVDPVTGVETTITTRTNTGTFTAALPGRNAAGDADWVIVFQSRDD